MSLYDAMFMQYGVKTAQVSMYIGVFELKIFIQGLIEGLLRQDSICNFN